MRSPASASRQAGEHVVWLELAGGGGAGEHPAQLELVGGRVVWLEWGGSRAGGGTAGGGPLLLSPTVIPPAPPLKNSWIHPWNYRSCPDYRSQFPERKWLL